MLKAWTDYPIEALGDSAGVQAPIRECLVRTYDGNKYCRIEVVGVMTDVKTGYLYQQPGRVGDVEMDKEMKPSAKMKERIEASRGCPPPEDLVRVFLAKPRRTCFQAALLLKRLAKVRDEHLVTTSSQ